MTADILFTNFYLFVFALTVAVLEIQIEGENGWAGKLPTWRPSTSLWYMKAYAKVFFGKKLTGYHIILFLIVLLLFHLPFALGIPFALDTELKALSWMCLFITTEDFLWFVLNPAFGVKRFFSNQVRWQETRLFYLPPEYFISMGISLLLVLPLVFMGYTLTEVIIWWCINFLTFLLLTLLTVLFTIFRNRNRG
jgi:hypothetical protein